MKIIDDEEYEKNKTFIIVLEEPILLEVGQKHGEEANYQQLLLALPLSTANTTPVHSKQQLTLLLSTASMSIIQLSYER